MIKKPQLYYSGECPVNHIQINFGTYYKEFAIENSFREEIVMVNGVGNKTRIPGRPSQVTGFMTTDGCVVIHAREHVGKRQNDDKKLLVSSVPIPLTRYTIDRFTLNNGPVYVEELDIVIGLIKDFDSITHPRAVPDLLTVIANVVEHMDGNEAAASIQFIANDPLGRTDKLYIQMCSRVVEIPVYNFKHNFPSITMVMRGNAGEYHREEILIDDVLSDAKQLLPVYLGCDVITRIAKDKAVLDIEVLNHVSGEEKCDSGYMKDVIDKIRQKFAADQKDQDQQHRRELDNLKTEHELVLKAKQNDLRNKDLRIDELTTQLSSWKSLHDAKVEVIRDATQQKAEDYKLKDSEFKMKKSELEYQGVVWKLLGGATIAVVTFVLTKKLNK